MTTIEVKTAKKELLAIIDIWEKDELLNKKIISLLVFAKKWMITGQGPKTKQNNLRKDIRSLRLMMKRKPNDSLKTILHTYEKEYIDLGGKLEDLDKTKKKTK